MAQKKTTKKGISSFLSGNITRKVLLVIVVILLLCGVILGVKKFMSSESKTTKLRLEDIGELVTQSAYCTEVNVTDASRKLFGVDIPFTQSKYIYSYDVIVRAGIDFSEIEWSVGEDKIEVRLPEAKVMGETAIAPDSFKIYHEKESIFRQIPLEETNEAIKNLQKTAETDAIANGLLENATENAKRILEGFFASQYDLDIYKIEFIEKKGDTK